MEFNCDNIDITDSEIGIQVHFGDLNGDSELYFLIQKYFDEEEGSYIETHDFDLAGHFSPNILLDNSKCIFEYGKHCITIIYQGKEKFRELEKCLGILGSVEIIKEK